MTEYLWDVSNYQDKMTEVNFRQGAAEGIAGSIILATDGTSFQNYMFSKQLDWTRKCGMVDSAYHYIRNASISEQIRNIKRTVPLDCPVIPDSEEGSGGLAVLDNVISALQNEGYLVPLEYLPRWWWAGSVMGSPSLANRGRRLWASWYPDYVRRTKEAGAAMLPASVWAGYGGNTVAITQFTSSGAAGGYAGPLDLNVFPGSRDELAALFGGEDMAPSAKDIVDELLSRWIPDPRATKPTGEHNTTVSNALWSTWHTVHFGDEGVEGIDGLYPSNADIVSSVQKVGDAIADTLGVDADALAAKLAPVLIEGLKASVGSGAPLDAATLRAALVGVLNDPLTSIVSKSTVHLVTERADTSL
jgi:hypothetical protein